MKRHTRDPVGVQRARTKRTKLAPPVREEFSLRCIQEATKALANRLLQHISPRNVTSEELLAGARCETLTEDDASWIYYAPGWYKRLYSVGLRHEALTYSEWVDALWDLHPRHRETIKMFGKDVLLPRFQQVYGQSCRSSGRYFEAMPFPTLLDGPVQCLQALVTDNETGETLTKAGLLNWYEDGDQYVGPHADDESHIHANSPVFSISFGASRKFVFSPRDNASEHAKRLEMMLHDGDLLVMGGTTQRTHKHALPKMKACKNRRISFTMRCFKELNRSTS